MNRGRWVTTASILLLTGGLAWLLFVALPSWYAEPEPIAPNAAGAAAKTAQPRIKVTLFYVAPDGLGLEAVEQEIPVGGDPLEQARRLLEAQLAPAPSPRVSAIPSGTALRAVYLTDGGRAVVDLTRELSARHPGGSLNERLTVATIVEALTANLPAIDAVQILIDGKEVDTLAGHVDLHRLWTRLDVSVEHPAPAGPAGEAGLRQAPRQ